MESDIKKRVKKIFHEILTENALEENQLEENRAEIANTPRQKPSDAKALLSKPERYQSKTP